MLDTFLNNSTQISFRSKIVGKLILESLIMKSHMANSGFISHQYQSLNNERFDEI